MKRKIRKMLSTYSSAPLGFLVQKYEIILHISRWFGNSVGKSRTSCNWSYANFSDEMYKATAYYVNENILKPISSYVQSNPLTHELNSISRPNPMV